MDRRKFLSTTALGSAGMVLGATPQEAPAIHTRKPADRLRIGVIGTGLRGQSHIALALQRDDCDVTAICDIDERMLARTRKIIADAGRPAAREYTGSEEAWRELLAKEDLDAVLIATPWRWHSVMCNEAMKAGRYVGT
ncbi:MAG: twin-arginine translocation signal domain-containing protein, partial [Bacteroidetes bacterium]